jgi:hypothetical protein
METITNRQKMPTDSRIILADLPAQLGDDIWIEVRMITPGDRPSAPAPIDWSRYAGTLGTTVDPVEFQRQIRAEWDHRP